MEFYHKLFFGPESGKNRKKILWKLKHKKPLHDIFLITLPSNEENLFDIIPANLLLLPCNKKKNLFVLGVGKGRDEVLELLRAFVEKIYTETGDLKITDYIGEK